MNFRSIIGGYRDERWRKLASKDFAWHGDWSQSRGQHPAVATWRPRLGHAWQHISCRRTSCRCSGCAALRPSMGTLGGQRSIEGLGLLRWESWLDSLRSWGILFCLWDLVGLIALLTLDSMYHRWVSGLVCSLDFCKCVCVYVYVCLCVLGSFMFVSVSVFAVCFWLPVCVCVRT